MDGFKWRNEKFNFWQDFIQNYDENKGKGYKLEVNVDGSWELEKAQSDLPFLPKIMNYGECQKVLCNLHDKKKYFIHIKSLKQALDDGLVLKKGHKVIESYHKTWVKLYIEMNTKLRTKAEKNFEKNFFKLMNSSVFRKTMTNIKKHKGNL